MRSFFVALLIAVAPFSSSAMTVAEFEDLVNIQKQVVQAYEAGQRPVLTDRQRKHADDMIAGLVGAGAFARTSNCEFYDSRVEGMKRAAIVYGLLLRARDMIKDGHIKLDRIKFPEEIIGMTLAHEMNCGPEDGSRNPNMPRQQQEQRSRPAAPGTLL